MSSEEEFSDIEEEEQDANLEDPAAALRSSAHIPSTEDAGEQGSPRSVTRTSSSSSSSSENRDFDGEFAAKHQEIQREVEEKGIEAIRSCIFKSIDGCV